MFRFQIWYAINSGMAENTLDQKWKLAKKCCLKNCEFVFRSNPFHMKNNNISFFFMQNACSLLLYMEIENTIQQVANRIVNFIEMKNSFLFACTLTKT